MNKVIVRAPVRADLAGGTLDLWPIYLFHPGSRTVNVAISYYAESEVCETGHSGIEVHLTDQQYRQRYASLQELAGDPKAALIYRALEHFRLDGISITTRTDAPRGSGLGGSSALTVTLVRALSEIAGAPVDAEHLVFLVRDLETRLLGVPAGIQDYYPPVFGGLASLRLEPGMPRRHPLSTPVADLEKHMLMHYTGVAHFSGTNNWEMYKRQVEGKKKIQKGFANIAATSVEMEKALEAGNFEAAGRALAKEWQNRKALIDGISTPEIDEAITAATNAGAWGGKVCGAGGGGCIVFLHPPERRQAIIEALSHVPGRVLNVVPVAQGLTIRRGDDAQSTVSAGRAHIAAPAAATSLEQLYVHGDNGDYKPFVLAEGIVTHIDARSGTHHVVRRSYVAPVEDLEGRVLWHQARAVEPEKLDMRAVPDPNRQLSGTPVIALLRNGAGIEESFRHFLEETERLRIFHNPQFGMYSEPNESREAFLARCLEEANRRVTDQADRLESTFRRRFDQLREKSEREQRGRESADEAPHEEIPDDVNVSWGQTLYNITSGKPAAAATEAPQSVREGDYLENIARIQRAWEKELQGMRDELTGKAREIEDVQIPVTAKNIEVKRYLVLWAGALP